MEARIWERALAIWRRRSLDLDEPQMASSRRSVETSRWSAM